MPAERDADGVMTSSIYCDHANEMPAKCPCDSDCYCKKHSCASPERFAAHPPKWIDAVKLHRGPFKPDPELVRRLAEQTKRYLMSIPLQQAAEAALGKLSTVAVLYGKGEVGLDSVRTAALEYYDAAKAFTEARGS